MERSLLPESIQEQHIIQHQQPVRPVFFNYEPDEFQIRFPAIHDQNHTDWRAPFVVWRRPTTTRLLIEDRVYASCSSLDDTGPLEGIRRMKIARSRWSDKQVIQPYSFGETTGIGNLDSVIMPLDMNGAQLGIVTMDQRFGQCFPESPRRVVGHTNSKEPYHEFPFTVSSPKP